MDNIVREYILLGGDRVVRQRDSIGPMKLLHWLFPPLAASALLAQTGQITGKITDQGGAVIPATQVTIRESSIGRDRVLESNADGLYTASALQPGEYSVTAAHAGFKTVTKTGIQLQVDQDLRVDFPLELGSVTDKVEVSADAAVLETETQTQGQVVQGRQVVELPLLGRNPYALGELVPGVRVARGVNDLPVDQISTASVSINGARSNANEYFLDGAPNTAAAQNQPIIYANADSVQEFKVETSTFSAEYGRAAGGVFNVVTKSGTNGVHFTLYELFRNDKLNSIGSQIVPGRNRLRSSSTSSAEFWVGRFGGTRPSFSSAPNWPVSSRATHTLPPFPIRLSSLEISAMT